MQTRSEHSLTLSTFPGIRNQIFVYSHLFSMDNILIVDDDPYVRKLIEVTLRDEFAVTVIADAIGALELIVRLQPCAIFLDVVLPHGTSGLELLVFIRGDARTQHIPIALVTASAQQADRALGLDKGANIFFEKPFSPNLILTWARQYKSLGGITRASSEVLRTESLGRGGF